MAINIFLSFSDLLRNHPNYIRIHTILTGPVAAFFNTKIKNEKGKMEYEYETCCAQISYALNETGLLIYNNGILPRDRVTYDAQGREYLFSVPELNKYLTNRYSPPELFAGMGSAASLSKEIGGKKGIILFGNRHADLWNGDNFQFGGTGLYIENVLWRDDNNLPRIIYFWEVQSYLDDKNW